MFTNCKTQRDILPLSPHVTLDYQTKIFKADLNVLGIQFSLPPTKPVIFFFNSKNKTNMESRRFWMECLQDVQPSPSFSTFQVTEGEEVP